MNGCPYCGRKVTRKFGHYARHVAECAARHVKEVNSAESIEDEAPAFTNAHPRVFLGSGVTVWKRNG